ncbi:hypothetical protein V1477_001478 [Vespula maculifrons]|uniref:Uncharacterized protein n=1 Tax=Vespula maculifrons TaxID=7453 RepID=A0ABD2CZY1_VESMC
MATTSIFYSWQSAVNNGHRNWFPISSCIKPENCNTSDPDDIYVQTKSNEVVIYYKDKLFSIPSQFYFDLCSTCNVNGHPLNGRFDSNRLFPLAKAPHL